MPVLRISALIFIIYIAGFLGHALYLKKTVYGDGIFYYAWLRSIVIDHDINFRNEYEFFHVNQLTATTGLLANKYSVGPALLWSPAFTIIHSIIRGDGYALPYQLAVGLSSVFYAVVGLILLNRLLTTFFSSKVSMLTVLALAFATNLIFYGSLDTVNSHALSFFAVTLYLSFLLAKEKNWIAIGFSLGLLGLIRTQDVIFGILLLPVLSRRPGYNLVATSLYLIAGFFLVFLPQLLAWRVLYGQFLLSPYLTGGESFNLFAPHFAQVLFSIQNGLFLYSPILFLGLIGLFFWNNHLRFYCFLAILLELLIVASWSTWWQGESFGSRMLVSSLPLFAPGLAYVFHCLSQRGWNTKIFLSVLIGPLATLNTLLVIFFLSIH